MYLQRFSMELGSELARNVTFNGSTYYVLHFYFVGHVCESLLIYQLIYIHFYITGYPQDDAAEVALTVCRNWLQKHPNEVCMSSTCLSHCLFVYLELIMSTGCSSKMLTLFGR